MQRLDALLEDAVARGAAPGLCALVADSNRELYAGVAGRRAAAEDIPLPGDTIFWWASMTKAVTSVAALQLVERGLLTLSAPIARWLPALRAPEVLDGFDDAGRPKLRRATRPITLRHLLTHTAGYGYDAMNATLARARGPDGPQSATTRKSLLSPLLFDPGKGWEYGVSTDWVGLAIEAATGQSLDRHLAEHILEPLRMRDTAFVVGDASATRVAPLHARAGAAAFATIPSLVTDRSAWDYFSGGAGLLGPASDYIRFLRMILNKGSLDGSRILKPKTVAAMMCNQVGRHRAGVVGSAAPAVTLPFDLLAGQEMRWGLAGMVNITPRPQGRAAGSMGWAGLANTYFWVDPESDLCAVLMAQYLPFADPQMIALTHEFETAVYASFRRTQSASSDARPAPRRFFQR